MKKEFFYNAVSNRQTRARWQAEGALDGREKAREIAKKILKSHKPLAIDKIVERKILGTIPGIVRNYSN